MDLLAKLSVTSGQTLRLIPSKTSFNKIFPVLTDAVRDQELEARRGLKVGRLAPTLTHCSLEQKSNVVR